MIKAVEQYLEKYNMISKDDTVVAGVSGGADSVCMLLLLHEYQKKIEFKLVVVHVNHLIRANAGEDAEYVHQLCDKLGIPFYLYEKDVCALAEEQGISTEEAGRYVRYQVFEDTLSKYTQNGKIAVAHNQNDQAETMLFHLFRGTGLTGLSGILPVRDNIIRPLLCLERKQIEKYLVEQNVSWCIDATNDEDTYTRNKIRNQILPYVENEIVRNAVSHIAATADEMAQIRTYFEQQTKAIVQEIVEFSQEEAIINVEAFNLQPDILQRQILLYCMEKLTKGRKDIASTHILAIQDLFAKSGCKEVHLPYHLEAVKHYETLRIRIRKTEELIPFSNEVKIPGHLLLPNGKTAYFSMFEHQKDENIPEKTYTKWFDYDKILHCLVLRKRLTGDYLTINKNLSQKKLKDYFIQEKIPKDERDNIIVLADNSHILWVLGYRISEYYKITKETKRILQVIVK